MDFLISFGKFFQKVGAQTGVKLELIQRVGSWIGSTDREQNGARGDHIIEPCYRE